jgi:hypothetical protein
MVTALIDLVVLQSRAGKLFTKRLASSSSYMLDGCWVHSLVILPTLGFPSLTGRWRGLNFVAT